MSLGKFKQNRFGDTKVGDTTANGPAATDGLANVGESVISFFHVATEKDVFFKAFITTFNESYSPDFNEEHVFGRSDPIYTFKNTSRRITLSWVIPAETISEAYENLARVQELTQFLYPNYEDINNALTISQSPLVRMKVMNLAQKANTRAPDPTSKDMELMSYRSTNDPSRGLLGAIQSFSINHHLEDPAAGVFQTKQNTVLPKLIEVNMDFSVIHETPLGFKKGTDHELNEIFDGVDYRFEDPSFPYGATRTDIHDSEEFQVMSYSEKLAAERANETKREKAEQERANALARNYKGMFGQRRLERDKAFQEANEDAAKNGKLSAADQANYDYISSALEGQKLLDEDEATELATGA